MDVKDENTDLIPSRDISNAEITGSGIGSSDKSSFSADGTKAQDTGLHKAHFRSVSMERCCFEEMNLSTSAFLYANIENSAFDTVCFDRSNYVAVTFNGCTFDDGKFINARIFRSDLSGMEISGCKLEGATIEGIPVKSLLDAYRTLHPEDVLPLEELHFKLPEE